MTGSPTPVPDGYVAVTPYLCCKDAAAALAFYERAFGATERMRMAAPDGTVMHAEIDIAGGLVMLADEFPDMGFRSPLALGGSPVTIHLYVADVDSFAERAVAAGATLERPVADQFYGDRSGTLRDPFGHVWHMATRKEEVPADEMQRRLREMMAQGQP